jgi:hypothetical protein
MGRRKVSDDQELKHRLYTRVNDAKYQELQRLLLGDPQYDMSSLLRDILHNRPVRVFSRDQTLDNVMEELAKLRTEIRAIGVNINQITRLFNTYPEAARKTFYGKMAFKEYLLVEPKIEELLEIISKLAQRWLSD